MSRMDDPSSKSGSESGHATDQLRDTATQVQENLKNLGSQARDAATQGYDQVRQQANEYYEQGKQKAQEYEQTLEQYVQEKPIQSLLIAAGVGMVLGVLWKRS